MTSDFILAYELKIHGKLEEAIDVYRQNIQKNPNFSWSHYMLGETLEQLGCLDKAISAYSKSIELHPSSDSFHYKLGVVLAKQGKVNDAIISIEKAFYLRALPLYQKELTRIKPDYLLNKALKESKLQTVSSQLRDGKSSEKKGNFTHILCKSMPRSGHHLLERLLRAYYDKEYDYCRFYYSGCCLQIPCSKIVEDRTKVFMQKSHDFDLKDRIIKDFKFIIQYRHPIPRLFSDFELGKQAFMRNNRVDLISYEKQKAIFNDYLKRYLDYYPKFYCKWVKPNLNKDNFLILKYEHLKTETANSIKDVVEFIGDEFDLDYYNKVSQKVLEVRVDFDITKKYTEPVLKNNDFFDVELLKKYEKDIFELCPNINYESYHELNE